MRAELETRVNFYLQKSKFEKALSLLEQHRENTIEYKQLRTVCANELSNQYLLLIDKCLQNGEVEKATSLIYKYKILIGQTPEIEHIEQSIVCPKREFQSPISEMIEWFNNATILSAMKLFLLTSILYLVGLIWSIQVYAAFDKMGLSIGVDIDYILKVSLIAAGIGLSMALLIVNYIMQNRITQYRILGNRYSVFEVLCLLIFFITIPPLFYFYLYNQGYSIWKKTMTIGVFVSLITLLSAFNFSMIWISVGIWIFYTIALYNIAHKYNL